MRGTCVPSRQFMTREGEAVRLLPNLCDDKLGGSLALPMEFFIHSQKTPPTESAWKGNFLPNNFEATALNTPS